MTTNKQTADDLRAIATSIEQASTELQIDVRVSIHAVNDLGTLKVASTLITSDIRAESSSGHHWITGTAGSICVSVFYLAGLLGKTRVRRVKEVTGEVQTDLSLLRK